MSNGGIVNIEKSNPELVSTITAQSGTSTSIENNINITGSGIISTSATGSTLTIAASNVDVPSGGTGLTSTTAFSPICGGTTSTGALQSVASVGTSGQVFTSNGAGVLPSFEDAAAGGGGGPPFPIDMSGLVVGDYTYRTGPLQSLSRTPSSGTTGSINSANKILFTQVCMPFTASYTKIGIEVTTAGISNSFRIGLYNISNGLPSTPAVDSGDLAAVGTGLKEATVSSFDIVAGWYYFCIIAETGATAVNFRRNSDALYLNCNYPVSSTGFYPNINLSYNVTYGDLPTITQSSLTQYGAGFAPSFYIA